MMALDVHLGGWSAGKSVVESTLDHFGYDPRESLDLPANTGWGKETDGTD